MNVKNPYTLDKTLILLRKYLDEGSAIDAIVLLNSAIERSKALPAYAEQMRQAFCQGSTIQVRELLEVFGEYMEKPRDVFPPYPHRDAVNAIDSALYHVKMGLQQSYLKCAI